LQRSWCACPPVDPAELSVEDLQAACLPAELLAPITDRARQRTIAQELGETLRERDLIADRHEQSPRLGELGYSADGRGDERTGTAHRLGKNHWHALGTRGERDHTRAAQQPPELVAVDGRADFEATE